MSQEASNSPRSASTTPIEGSIPLPDLSGGSIPKVSSPLSSASTSRASPSSLSAQSLSSLSESVARHDPPKGKQAIPPEQTVVFEDTRKRVAQAVASVLGNSADITHEAEALYTGVEFLNFVPIPGLQIAANTLLNIWDAAQDADMNRLGCLRLTGRCAEILLSVREEIHEAGDQVGTELDAPLAKLEGCFTDIYHFMFKHKTRPWLQRYLKRDDIRRDIAEYHYKLQNALAIFEVSIQIRILKQVERTEKRRQLEMHALTATLASHRFQENPDDSTIIGPEVEAISTQRPYDLHAVSPSEHSPETVYHFATNKNALSIIDDNPDVPQDEESPQILLGLKKFQTLQNRLDEESDISDLRKLMRESLQTNSDAEILRVFQIGHQEMPDAIKALQRALERVNVDDAEPPDKSSAKYIILGAIPRQENIKQNAGMDQAVKRTEHSISMDSSTVDGSTNSGMSLSGFGSSNARVQDTLYREFIETGIESLRRISQGTEIFVPPTRTTTKSQAQFRISAIPGPGRHTDQLKKIKWSAALLINFLNARWSPLVEFLVTHADLISTQHTAFSSVDINSLSSYLNTLDLTPKIVDLESDSQLHSDPRLTASQRRKATQKEIELFLICGKVKIVCMIFDDHYTPKGSQTHEGVCIADHLRTLITNLDSDLKECGSLLATYSQRLINLLSQTPQYPRFMIYRWAIKFEEHRFRIQTALALYSSLYIGAFGQVMINRKITLAFSLFPELDPFREDIMDQRTAKSVSTAEPITFMRTGETDLYAVQNLASKAPLYKFNPSSRPSALPAGSRSRSRTSSFSSYATARDTISLANNTSSWHHKNSWYSLDEVSSYSVASSRTAETDYGLFYTRMALSQTSLDSTITEKGPNLRRSRSWTSIFDTLDSS